MIVEVYCDDEYYDEYPTHAKVTFNDGFTGRILAGRILELHKALLKIKADTISERSSVEFLKNEEGEEYAGKTECERIHINYWSNSVNWDAYIKNTNIRIYTNNISIDEIKDIHKILTAPEKDLPLLIGLKSEEANKILEERLKWEK